MAIGNTNPVTNLVLLSGFLGAGKTTLLNRILSMAEDLAGTVVIVNEFGALGIDSLMVQNTGADVIELASGCICCSLKIDLRVTLKRLWEQYRPERILIESTGVADPVGLFELFDAPELRHHMRLNKVITVLDADLWDARECFGAVFFNQLSKADLVLLNKIDTVAEDQVGPILKEIHQLMPHLKVVPTVHCNVSPDILWAERTCRELILVAPEARNGKAHRHFTSFSFQEPGVMNEACFKRFVTTMPRELFRMKGLVRFSNHTMLVNHVGGKSEWRIWPESAETRLTFVGWKVDGDETIQKLRRCRIAH